MQKQIQEMKELLKEASAPASKATPKHMFGQWQQKGDNSWPVERLHSMAEKNYGMDQVLAVNGFSKNRLTGYGHALQKMAGLVNPKVALDSNYTQEKLEKEYGFISVQKAATHGVPRMNGEVQKVALAESGGQTGGYLVPPQFQTELLRIAAEDAFIEKLARVVPMTSRTTTFPVLDVTTAQSTGTSPYFGGVYANWQPEAATIDETEPQFRQTEWTAYDLVLYTVCSNQLLMDNALGLDALLTQLFSDAMTWYMEYAFLRGTGSGNSMPLGIHNAAATYVQSRSASSTFKLVDAANMMARMHVRSWDTACWVMHPSVIAQLIQMTNGATNSPFLVWLNPAPNGSDGPAAGKLPKAFLNGLPIYFTEKVPSLGTKGDVTLVDWSYYLIGKRLDTQIDVSPHYLFRTNQMAWRVILRADGKPWLNSTITDANGWVSSPIVVLNT